MGVLRSGQTMATGAAWLLSGSKALGNRLIQILIDGDEDAKTLAGMFLVKGGDRGQRLTLEALDAGAEAPELVTVLQSIGGPEAEAALAQLAQESTRPVARWARQALNELGEIRRRRSQEA